MIAKRFTEIERNMSTFKNAVKRSDLKKGRKEDTAIIYTGDIGAKVPLRSYITEGRLCTIFTNGLYPELQICSNQVNDVHVPEKYYDLTVTDSRGNVQLAMLTSGFDAIINLQSFGELWTIPEIQRNTRSFIEQLLKKKKDECIW